MGRKKALAAVAAVTGAVVVLMKNPKLRGRAKSLASGRLGGQQAGGLNDAGLADKIRSEVLGSHPAARINVNVEERVAVLRGTVPTTEEISDIEQSVRKVSGITDVRNLLQTQDQASPEGAESPAGATGSQPPGTGAESPAGATGSRASEGVDPRPPDAT